MQCFHEAADYLWVARVFAIVLTYLAGVVVERPRLSNLSCNELDDDVHRADAVEIVGEVGADAKRWLHILLSFLLQGDGTVGVEGVGEDDLLRFRVNAQAPVFVTNPL